MENQPSFAQGEYAAKKKQTRRDGFLGGDGKGRAMGETCGAHRAVYPKGKTGRPPIGLERMLRIYFLQQWCGLADEALEDALYDSQALRAFAGIDLGSQGVPDATTLLGFRHLLAANNLTRAWLTEVNAMLGERGVLLREGTIIDATIIAAPSSTKNQERARDPEMRQVKKGNAWRFGMKAHIGVDLASGLVHTVEGTSANVADVAQAHTLLHGEEKTVFADAGCQGVEKRPEIVARFGPRVRFEVAAKRGKIKAMAEGRRKELLVGTLAVQGAAAGAGGASLPYHQESV